MTNTDNEITLKVVKVTTKSYKEGLDKVLDKLINNSKRELKQKEDTLDDLREKMEKLAKRGELSKKEKEELEKINAVFGELATKAVTYESMLASLKKIKKVIADYTEDFNKVMENILLNKRDKKDKIINFDKFVN